MWAEIKRLKPIERQPDGNLPRLTPQQTIRYNKLRKLKKAKK